jgi:hypothetical protein
MLQAYSESIEAGWQQVSPWYWAVSNELQLQGGTFGAKGHAYLRDIMDCDHPQQCGRKGAQMGFTVGPGVTRTLHGMKYNRYPKGVLYLFPTSDDVSDFSKSQFNTLISQNVILSSIVRNTDAAHIKQIGTAMLYLRGARAQGKIQGIKKTSSRLKTVAVDRIVYDERDEMDETMVRLAQERVSHSDVKEELSLSTPSIPDYGIDKLYAKSDQRVWMITCEACKTDTCLEIEFLQDPHSVIRQDQNGKGVRVCKKCERPIFPWQGHWVAQYPMIKDLVGWWISQLNSEYWDPWEIVKLYEDPPDGDLTEVMNSKLGMAYIAAENELTVQQVLACCGSQSMAEMEKKVKERGTAVAYGLDIQKDHLVLTLGVAISDKARRVIKVARVPSWNDVHDIASQFNTKAAVLDLEPETHKAREFQKAEPYKVWLCDYAENQKVSKREDEQTGLVVVKRTEFLDRSHNLIAGLKLELPRRCPEIDVFANQVCAAVKVLKEDQETGSKRYLYIRRDKDDYRHALSYFDLACQDPLMMANFAGGEGRVTNREIRDAYENSDPLGREHFKDGYQESYDPRFA